ncbi:MAG: hypothetical protein HFG01_05690 [Oscillibacter sp.]|nr:hypothetical protein [Oscillibacter sp.]
MLEIKGLRTEFIRYLEANYEYARPGVMASNVLFAYYHDIGMPFEAIFRDESSMEQARELLAVHFEKVGRKDPGGHAAVHHGCWVKFREFLEATDRLALLETAEAES